MIGPRRIAAAMTTAFVAAVAGGAWADVPAEGGARRGVIAVGLAETDVAPDRAVVRLTVRTTAKTAGEATRLAADRSAQVLDALRGKLGPGDRAETAGTSVQPVHVYEQGKPPRITGYTASHDLRAVTARIQEVGALLDAVTTAAEVSIDSVHFELGDPTRAQANALRLAAENARLRARAMADGLGLALGPVYSVREVGSSPPVAPRADFQRKMIAEASAETAVLPPQLRVRGEVEVAFELAPGSRP